MNKEKLIDGIIKTLDNSKSLCLDSKLLLENNRFPRSYTLAHLAREEFSKCFILYRQLVEVVLKRDVNWKKTRKRYRSHISKLNVDKALTLIILGDKGKELGLKKVFEGIDEANLLKNRSLYVDWKNDDFITPFESISKEIAERTLTLAAGRIQMYSDDIIKLCEDASKSDNSIIHTFKDIDLDELINKMLKAYDK